MNKINRFLLFMKMFLAGIFKFIAGVAVYLIAIFGVVVVAEIIGRFKILTIISLIVLIGIIALVIFIVADDFWSRYKRERDSRGL